MLGAKTLTPTVSPRSSTVVLVREKDRSMNLSVDYRKQNYIAIKDRYPLPEILDVVIELIDMYQMIR